MKTSTKLIIGGTTAVVAGAAASTAVLFKKIHDTLKFEEDEILLTDDDYRRIEEQIAGVKIDRDANRNNSVVIDSEGYKDGFGEKLSNEEVDKLSDERFVIVTLADMPDIQDDKTMAFADAIAEAAAEMEDKNNKVDLFSLIEKAYNKMKGRVKREEAG